MLMSIFQIVVAVHLNFCPAAGIPSFLSTINPRTLLEWMPRFLVPDLARERAYRALNYVETGSSYYAMQKLTVSSL